MEPTLIPLPPSLSGTRPLFLANDIILCDMRPRQPPDGRGQLWPSELGWQTQIVLLCSTTPRETSRPERSTTMRGRNSVCHSEFLLVEEKAAIPDGGKVPSENHYASAT